MHFTRILYSLLMKHAVTAFVVLFLLLNSVAYIVAKHSTNQQVDSQMKHIKHLLDLYIPIEVIEPISPIILEWSYTPADKSIPIRQRFGKSWQAMQSQFELDTGNLTIVHKAPISIYGMEFIVSNLIFALFMVLMMTWSHFHIYKHWRILVQLEAWANRITKTPKFKFYINNKNYLLVNTVRDLHKAKLEAEQGGQKADHFIRSQTFLDKSTGLGNRLYFEHRLDAVLDQDEKVYGAVLIIQYNVLDQIRTQEGKLASTKYLKMFSEILKAYLDDTAQSVVSRISSNEFAILLPFVDGNEVEKISLNILRMSQKVKLPEYVDSSTLCHIGADMYGMEDSSFQIMAEADMALRAAQLHGPSGWFMYDSGQLPASEIRGSVRWRTTIQNALENNKFVLYFQPVVDSVMRIHHHEVLSRLEDGKGEYIGAKVFLPMAKKCGLIPEIDKQNLKLIMDNLQAGNLAPVSVNIHIDSWQNRDFCNWLIHFLKQHYDYTGFIIFEISEFELAQHARKLASVFAAVERYGIQFMVDQVGLYVLDTRYLEYISAKYLKIHHSIVNRIHERPENQMFIRSLQSVATEVGMLIFATGVESEQELTVLKRLGIAGIQGHYIKRPDLQLLAATDEIELDGDNLDL